MNRLPQVLQDEIWKHVRGDRAYWKQTFTSIIHAGRVADLWRGDNIRVEVWLFSTQGWYFQWAVRLIDRHGDPIQCWPAKFDREAAWQQGRKLFRQYNF